ncbi:MAG TPA: hypothetical protein VKK79_13585, partial [Candidatus Lokiarchaeia archaeon]|nr:hypothetical protein [Candidatus Lokiarchaeia archaeon]
VASSGVVVECGATPQILVVTTEDTAIITVNVSYSIAGTIDAFFGFGAIGVIATCGIVGYLRQKKIHAEIEE